MVTRGIEGSSVYMIIILDQIIFGEVETTKHDIGKPLQVSEEISDLKIKRTRWKNLGG